MPYTTSRRATALGAGALLALAACADQPTQPIAPSLNKTPAPEPTAPPAQFVVLYKDGAEELADPATASGVKLGDMRHANGAVYAYVSDPAALRDDPNVEAVIENLAMYASSHYPIDALYFSRNWQWDMRQIKADLVPESVRGQGTRVCIIDSGVDDSHQDLAGKVVARTSFVDPAFGYPGPGPSPAHLDSSGHGSHVASTVTSNGIGVAPVAPDAMLLVAKTLNAAGSGLTSASLEALAWCAANGADVINMSLGTSPITLPLSPGNQAFRATYEAAIQAARAAGAVVVVASGNDNVNLGPGRPSEVWPSSLAGTVTVGASAPSNSNFPFVVAPPDPMFDSRAGYSNYGENTDIWAPGGSNFINRPQANIIGVCSSQRIGGSCAGGVFYRSIGGTSMASPHVAGVAALITSRSTAPKGLARTQAIENCLYTTGDPITITVTAGNPPVTSTTTRPRLNALRAATEPCPGI